MLSKECMAAAGESLTQHQFEQLVNSGSVVQATINYAPNSVLNEVVGEYMQTNSGKDVHVPFRAKIRLTPGLERQLLSMPQFQPREPNAMLINILVSVLPFVIIAALIWFFFIRQIRKSVGGVSAAEINARSVQQQERFDRILDKWEEQSRRMDAVLDKTERERGTKT